MSQKPCHACGMSMEGACSHPRCPARTRPENHSPMTDTPITRDEVDDLAGLLRLRANSINMNYLQHPIADDLRTAADRLITLRDELDRVTARVAELEAALTPFVKTGELFPEPPGSVEYDQCIYNPAAGKEFSLCGDDLRRARAALHTDKGDG